MDEFTGPFTSASLPAGIIQMFGGSSAPAGYLLCDGTSYTTASFPGLFAAIGYTFGGVGANFNVPDLRDRFPLGTGSHAGEGGSGGSFNLVNTVGDSNHLHQVTGTTGNGNANHTHTPGAGAGTSGGQSADHQHILSFNSQGEIAQHTHTAPDFSPYLSVQYVIKT